MHFYRWTLGTIDFRLVKVLKLKKKKLTTLDYSFEFLIYIIVNTIIWSIIWIEIALLCQMEIFSSSGRWELFSLHSERLIKFLSSQKQKDKSTSGKTIKSQCNTLLLAESVPHHINTTQICFCPLCLLQWYFFYHWICRSGC